MVMLDITYTFYSMKDHNSHEVSGAYYVSTESLNEEEEVGRYDDGLTPHPTPPLNE